MAVLSVPKTDLYKFIREALIHKRYNRAALDYRYRGVPIRYEPTIFDEARRIFKKRGLINYLKNDQILIDRFVDQVDNDPSLGIFKQPETALAKEDPLQLEQEHTAWERAVQVEQQVYSGGMQIPQATTAHGPSISTILASQKAASTEPGQATTEPPLHIRQAEEVAVPPSFKNVGKYLTVGRIATAISMGIGAIAGSILGPAGTFAGAGVGALMPSFIRGGGGRILGNIGNGAINAGLGISNQISTGTLIKLPPKKFWAFIGLFFLLIGVGIFSAVFTPPGEEQPTAEAAPVGGGGPAYAAEGTGIITCPLNNARISCGSQFSNHPVCNHCGTGYEPYTCPAGTDTGRDTAIDVVNSDGLVFLPYILGSSVQWTVDESGTPIPISEGGGGIAVAATAKAGEKTYRIRFVHISTTSLKVNDQAQSGTLVGQYASSASHTHITVKEDGIFKPADSYFNLCSK